MKFFSRAARGLAVLGMCLTLAVQAEAVAVDTEALKEKIKETADVLSDNVDKIVDSVGETMDELRPVRKETAKKIDVEKVKPAVDSINAFALDFYGKVAEREKGDLFFSPHSIVSALEMTYFGAGGATASEMKKALHLPDSGVHVAMQVLLDRIESASGESDVILSANRVWLDETLRPSVPYTTLLQDYYGSSLTKLNFAERSDEARKEINSWVESQTADRIKDLLQPGDVGKDTTLVLTNAIYFKSAWQSPFDEKHTQALPFRFDKDGQPKDLPTMYKQGSFAYAETEGVQLLKLPYRMPGFSMLIALPRVTEAFGQLQTLEKTLSAQDGAAVLQKWIGGMEREMVRVWLPKFEQKTRMPLKETLESMGMKMAFTSDADFSGMLEPDRENRSPLSIGSVIHQTFLAVDEAGTEAAAATAVLVERMSAIISDNIVEFRADHPFLYFIMDDESGAILFMGRQSFQ